ncbi:aminotransferase class III-fold pyridoxal phosphate-dependent enzyme [Streptomyces sp. M10(2022)]
MIVYRSELDIWKPGAHAGTFRGNQLAMAAGAATLAYVRKNGLAERAATLGARMLARLQELSADHRSVGNVRGRGLMIGLELVDPEAAPAGSTSANGAAPPPIRRSRRWCSRNACTAASSSNSADVTALLSASSPLTLTDEQATAVVDRLADALRAAERSPHRRAAAGSTR